MFGSGSNRDEEVFAEMGRRGPGRPARGVELPAETEVLGRGLAAFAELGYEAVSVRELNARLGVGHTFIHDRYGSKEAFWRAVVDHALGAMAADLLPVLTADHDDDLELLTASVRAFHRAAARRPELTRLIDYEAARDSERLAYLFTLIEPINALVRPAFERMVAAGRIRDMPWYAFHFAVTKPAAMFSQIPLARLFGRPPDAADDELLAEFVLHGLLR